MERNDYSCDGVFMEMSRPRLIIKPKVEEKVTIMEMITKDVPPTWEPLFKDAEKELEDVSSIITDQECRDKRRTVPLRCDIFRAFYLTPLKSVSVIIVGQDPYPQMINGVPRAQGLSFSIAKGDKIPSSLNNIYKELAATIKGFVTPNHGDLTKWAVQGVLLLNTSLTTTAESPGAHGKIWLGFVRKTLTTIATHNKSCIMILWGNSAKELKAIAPSSFEFIEGVHPSGLSANRGFFGGDYFNKCNELLMKQKKAPIDWTL